MFSRAVHEAVRRQHEEFAARMQRDGLKSICFLGGRNNEPGIIDYSTETGPEGLLLKLRIQFPKHPKANSLLDAENEVHVVSLPLDADDRPKEGATFSQQAGERVFTGKVRYDGDQYRFDYTVTDPFDADKVIC